MNTKIKDSTQEAIDAAFKSGNMILHKIPRKGKTPTLQEILDFVENLFESIPTLED